MKKYKMINSHNLVFIILAFCLPFTNSQIQRRSDQKNVLIPDNFNAFSWFSDHFLKLVVPTIRINEEPLIQEFWTFEEAIGCPACKVFSWTMQRFNNKYVNWAITQYLTVTCEFLTPIIISDMSSRICSGLVNNQFQEMGFPVLFDELLEEQNLCTFILELCDMDKWEPVDVNEWVFNKINEKPRIAIANNFVNELYRKREEDEQKASQSKLIKVVLFSDLHVDYDYQAGSSINCGRIICCRKDSGPAQTKDDAAGYWGEYKCDPPEQLILNMFEFIADSIQPDLALWGGDSIPHNAESLSFEQGMYTMTRVSQQVSKAFLGSGIKVYAAVGNHDTYPLDSFKGHRPGETELVAKWSANWDVFLDNDQQLETLRDYGYYSAELKFLNGTKIGQNAKVISFNSNFCFFNNFQQYAQFKEPGRIFTWLESELSQLEKDGGAAIMLAHVPNLDQCNRQFGKRWHALMDRYQHIIRWGMAAHNHDQQWQVARDVLTKQPIGMNFIVGSVTPYQFNRAGKQPSFQVLTMDPETLIPIDIETYSMDIDEANISNKPEWIKNFSDREVYNFKDLSPQSYLDFASKTFSDPEAAQLFKDHMQLLPPSAKNSNRECDHKCQLMIYCMTTSNNFDEHQFCNGHDKFDLFGKSQSETFATPMSIEDLIQHNWYEPKN